MRGRRRTTVCASFCVVPAAVSHHHAFLLTASAVLFPLIFAASLLLERSRLGSVTSNYIPSPPRPGSARGRARARAYDGMFRGICVDIAPPSLRDDAVPAGVRVESLRPLPPSTPGDHAPWLDRLPDRPAVTPTLGTGLQRPRRRRRPARRPLGPRLQRDRHGRPQSGSRGARSPSAERPRDGLARALDQLDPIAVRLLANIELTH